MSVHFIIDSASDLQPKDAKRLGVTLLPLTVFFGGDGYADGVEMTHQEFYQRLANDPNHPTTSQVTPAAFEAAYAEAVGRGDECVVITLSGGLSGTYQSACIAAEDYEGKVFVVDSRNVTVAEQLLLHLGLRLREQGMTAREIAAKLDEEKEHLHLMALLDTLEYLKKGGRISAATALAGGLLSIKPVITVAEGVVELKGKARGSKQGLKLLRELVEQTGGMDPSLPYGLAYTGMNDDAVKRFAEECPDLWAGFEDRLTIDTVGAVIGVHAGPGAMAIGYFSPKGA